MPKSSDSNADAWAVKVGGSLFDSKYLMDCLASINKNKNKKIIIIPGGGPFADQVRLADDKFCLEPHHSHNMAVLAMQQFGYVLASMSSEFVLANTTEKINQAWNLSKVVIWEPYLMVSDQCTLDRAWDVTSDSLAAWLASELGMRNLLLIKSSEKVLETTDLTELARVGCVDIGLQDLVDRYQINAFVLHKSKSDSLSELLNSD